MLNSANFGVAQDRKRVYLVGYLGERSPIEILAFGESGNEDSDESGEQAELKQLIGLEGRFKYSQVQHYSERV